MATKTLVSFLAAGLTDNAGNPLTAGKVYHYEAGTTTTKVLYTDYAGTTPAAQPIVLDGAGAASVYGSGLYKFVIQDSEAAVVRTIDNVAVGAVTVDPTKIVPTTDRQLVFSTPAYAVGANNLRVYLDGGRLSLENGDYSETSSTSITLNSRYAPSIVVGETVLLAEVI